jgi:pSer/pThr/pTyr-binding forkhead associated (FHA) protein
VIVFAQLVPADGGEAITIDKDVIIVGRQSEHCDIVLTRKSVSKIHCVIAKTDGLLFVRDLDSTNGTKVNGQRIVRGALLPGDQLAFAGEKFKVHMGPAQQTPEASPIDRTEMIESFVDPSVAEGFGDGSVPSLLYKEPPPRAAEDLVE